TPNPANFAVTVTDSIQNSTGKSFTLAISGAAGTPLSVTTTSLPGATIGTAYTATLAATGGTPPYTWSTTPVTGSLPAGLTISASGTITGTPASNAATSSFTVKVTDSTNASANSSSLSITVNPANTPPQTVTITPTGNQTPAQ